jgi:hypothetical protein
VNLSGFSLPEGGGQRSGEDTDDNKKAPPVIKRGFVF